MRQQTSSGVINGDTSAFESAMNGGAGMYEIHRDDNHVSVSLCSEDAPETSIQVSIDMDAGFPRVIIYSADGIGEPLFSMHACGQGTIIQYMQQADSLLEKGAAPKEVEPLLERLTHRAKPSWFIPAEEAI